jgi:2-keto-4-pentenoate hydratase/2-oxohepta-3-ene-1,7-dioic acid hydratase in catechol pathway
MRFVRYKDKSGIHYGIVDGDKIQAIDTNPFSKWKKTKDSVPLKQTRLMAPCVPTKIVAVGLNYADHAMELSMDAPKEPIIFLKPPTSVIGSGDEIVFPEMSRQVDYEAEIAVVISKTASMVEEDEAPNHILGYTCANDVTARDLQRADGQWTRAKSFDTFAPLGPWIDTDFDPTDKTVEALLNGMVVQQGSTRDMLFSVPRLIGFISRIMTLNPGDVIMTGTPPGVGSMQPGDMIQVAIGGLGVLTNTIIKRAD